MSDPASVKSARYERHRWIRRKLWSFLPKRGRGRDLSLAYRAAKQKAIAEFYARREEGFGE